jgi:pimeloyl-ACP methyl ester carboxylesterase
MVALYILVGILILLVLGWIYQRLSLQRDLRNYPPPGKMVDIGGYQLHLQVSGEGSPTVILEAGFGDYSIQWKDIQARLEKFSRVVSYDRAGMGWSDASPFERDPSRVAEEVHLALKKAGIEGPYIIMGHSLGGIFARHFARKYLDKMAGVLLLDSTYEIEETPPELSYVYKNLMRLINIGSFLVPMGFSRLISSLSRKEKTEMQKLESMHALNPKTYRAYKGEFQNVIHRPAVFEAGSLKDVPLVVLYAEANITPEAIQGKVKNPEETVKQVRAAIRASNEQLGTLSSHSEVLMSPAGHYIQRDDPDLVVNKICGLIEISATPKE